MIRNYILILSIFLLTQGCELNDPDEDNIPAYIHIPKIELDNEYFLKGYTYDIKDAWIYVNDKLIGAFELPVTAPVLEKGRSKIRVRAGIIENGIANTRTFYPFYENFELELDLKPMHTDTIYPIVKYTENKTVAWHENFNGQDFSVTLTPESNVGFSIVHDTNAGTHHVKYLKADLINDNDHFEVASIESFVLPRANRPVFFEFDFKSDVTLAFGYYVTTSVGTSIYTFMFLHPADEWKKIYIQLTPSIGIYELDASFRMFFGAINEEGVESSVYLDNLKLIHN